MLLLGRRGLFEGVGGCGLCDWCGFRCLCGAMGDESRWGVGGRDRDRTCNPGLRRSVLYPIELLAPMAATSQTLLAHMPDTQGIRACVDCSGGAGRSEIATAQKGGNVFERRIPVSNG